MFASDASSSSYAQQLTCSPKHAPNPHLFVRQPHALQIIQLVECTSPPPQTKYPASLIPSSSYPSDDSDNDSYESASTPPEDDEPCSSYCSSAADEPCSAPLPPLPPLQYPRDPTIDDTYAVRMRRIRAWRDALLAKESTLSDSSAPIPPSRKRKASDSHCTADICPAAPPHAHCSPAPPRKLARSPSPSPSARSLSAHSCPACDADFPSPQSLRQHGRASASMNDACRVAVEYGFE
ncbi:hypothetical protein DENSPDRAFT_878576 [Dentipellis sp. KUC8613]|nr:hypothetical protein DENSPDRAFT_878576 [Dentipellis sp. KUC8613]